MATRACSVPRPRVSHAMARIDLARCWPFLCALRALPYLCDDGAPYSCYSYDTHSSRRRVRHGPLDASSSGCSGATGKRGPPSSRRHSPTSSRSPSGSFGSLSAFVSALWAYCRWRRTLSAIHSSPVSLCLLSVSRPLYPTPSAMLSERRSSARRDASASRALVSAI